MKFLLDENADARLVPYLKTLGHDVTAIVQDYPTQLSDEDVLALALQEQRILLTNDLDFGELIVRRRLPHAGSFSFACPPSSSASNKRGSRMC